VSRTSSSYLSFSPWILAIAGLLLLLVLGLFGISNYQREKELLGRSMEQRGLTLMRFINSSAREGLRQRLRAGDTLPGWEELVGEAMQQATEQPGVISVLLVDKDGAIHAAAGLEKTTGELARETLDLLEMLPKGGEPGVLSRVLDHRESGSGSYRIQVVAWQVPPHIPEHLLDPLAHGRGRRLPMMRRHGEDGQILAWQEDLQRLRQRPLIYVVELDFQQYSGSLQRQVLQLVLLAVVILLVALGGTLSYMTLKGLRGSQQRLGADG